MHGLDRCLDAHRRSASICCSSGNSSARAASKPFGKRDGRDLLALLFQPGPQQRKLAAERKFLLRRVVEDGEGHVVVGADRRRGDRSLPGSAPAGSSAVASSRSCADPPGVIDRRCARQLELGEATSDLVMKPAELVKAEQRLLDVGRPHEIEAPLRRVDDLAGVRLALGDRMEHVEKALVRKMERGELLDSRSRAAARNRRRSSAVRRRLGASSTRSTSLPAVPARFRASRSIRERPRFGSRIARTQTPTMSQRTTKSRTRNSSRVMCQRRIGFHMSIGQCDWANNTSARS